MRHLQGALRARGRAAAWLAAVALAAVALPCGPARAASLGLEQCIIMAAEASSGVKQGAYRSRWEEEKLKAATRRFFPKMDLQLSHEPKVDYFGRPIEDKDIYASEVQFTQPLYKSGALTLAYDQAKQGMRLAELLSQKERLEAARKVVPAYYKLISARTVHKIRSSLLAKARQLQDLAQHGFDLGHLRKEDVLSASAKRLEVAYQAEEAASESREAAYQLKELLKMPREQVLKVRDQEPDYKPPKGPDELLDQAQKANPELLHARASEDYQKLGLSAAEAKEGPRFNLVGRYGLEGDDFPGPDKFYSVMLNFEMNFGDSTATAFYGTEHQFENRFAFYDRERDLQRKGVKLSILDGSSPAAEIAEARMRRLQARDEVLDTRAKLRSELLTLWQELERQRARMDLAGQQQSLQSERLAVARARLKTGSAPPAKVLERQLDLADAEVRLVEARFDRARILSQMCILTGGELCLKDLH